MRTPTLLLAGTLLALTPLAQADEDSTQRLFGSKHMLGVGAALQKADAEVRATAGNLPEVGIDLEDLGMEDDYTSWTLEYRWRFSPRWMLVGMAYTFDESGRRSVARDFNFDGKEFQAGAAVSTSFSIDTYILDVLYQVYVSDRAEILLGGGIHAMNLETAIKGRAFIGEIEQEAAVGSSDLLAPLPNLRAHLNYELGNNWGLGVTMGWLSATYGDYDGSFAYIHPRIGYEIGDHWAATLGYQYVDIDLTQDKSSNREVALDATFTGPTVNINYRF
ncbi:outer membrane beta-barrel protein [Pseudohalioglobus lutimaris]|uniref:Uncharacterized protein n=1 Tax=Pseudohalioglobus lutimaris TaxID=1737061 RepID=A0A2N5WZS6_9GAMM|nr:outer membrane beta-barrel protein [Pseudohalioglobus lutimaris]PLW67706.1 hypothetical protein C0039_16030 [Pseudohalioglobus lutimaris]